MTSANLASTSQKTGNQATPFDQIRTHELAEQERTEKEIALFERERQSVMRTKQDQEKKAEEEAREEARAEFVDFKENGLMQILQEGDAKTTKTVSTLKSLYEKNAPALIDELTKTALSSLEQAA